LPRLAISHISTQLLRDISLDVPEGTCVTISGSSGAGKSLFLRAVADLDPHEGRVWLGERERREFMPHQWRRRVALLPAESRWWADTTGQHFITVSPPFLNELGFDADVMNWQVSRLSSGEKQRLALARMLEQMPEALLLDEPTANLDQVLMEKVEQVILAYMKKNGSPVIWVTHDPEQVARVSNRHYNIIEGRLSGAVT
jgi:ABC-type iron transport system FetAB ATPase subunit